MTNDPVLNILIGLLAWLVAGLLVGIAFGHAAARKTTAEQAYETLTAGRETDAEAQAREKRLRFLAWQRDPTVAERSAHHD